MKELQKRLLALGMGAVMIFAMGAAGCNSGNQGQTTQTPSTGTTTPDPDKDKDNDKDKGEPSVTPDPDKDQDDPETPPQTPAKTKAEAISAFNAAVQKINADKNFTYTGIGAEYVAEFEGAKLKVTENGASVFYVTEGEQNYSYTLQDSVWHKDFSETTAAGIFSSLTAVLSDVVWSDFEAEENLLTGTASGETIEATVTETALTVETAQKKFTLTNLGTTAVALPADAVDDTDASNFIFTTDENGDYVWNRKLIAETIKNWWPEGYYKKIQRQDCELIDILTVEYEEGRLTFLSFFSGDSGKFVQKIGISKSYFNAEELQTVSDFQKYLNSREYPVDSCAAWIKAEYTTHDEDYETAHKQEFETLTKNVFDKYHKEKDAAAPDYTGAKILFGFKGFASDMHLGSDGYGKEFSLHYLVERKDGTIELIETRVRGLTSGLGYLENILQNQEGKWSFEYPDKVARIAEISGENLVLFDAPIMTIGKIA